MLVASPAELVSRDPLTKKTTGINAKLTLMIGSNGGQMTPLEVKHMAPVLIVVLLRVLKTMKKVTPRLLMDSIDMNLLGDVSMASCMKVQIPIPPEEAVVMLKCHPVLQALLSLLHTKQDMSLLDAELRTS